MKFHEVSRGLIGQKYPDMITWYFPSILSSKHQVKIPETLASNEWEEVL